MNFFKKAVTPEVAKEVAKKTISGVEAFYQEMSAKKGPIGRSWKCDELRIKSYDDLNKLWFVLIKERDQLLAGRIWAKKNNLRENVFTQRLPMVKRSMARIKVVLSERERAVQKKEAAERLLQKKAHVVFRTTPPSTEASTSSSA